MDPLKYIRIKGGISGSFPAILVFPSFLSHAEAAAGREVISAGFVNENVWECYGRSDSLGLDSRPEDTALLRAMFGAGKSGACCGECSGQCSRATA